MNSELVPGPDGENCGIYTGDARELAVLLPDESIELVMCDPIYWNHDDYRWLAELGDRVLVDGGSLIAQCGVPDIPALLPIVLGYGLTYNRILCEKFPAATWPYHEAKCFVGWRPYLWLVKGKYSGDWVFDAMMGGGKMKGVHHWQDSPRIYFQWISRIVRPGGIVLDPFTGSGTVPSVCKALGIQYIAFEIDEGTAQKARERVMGEQYPLPFEHYLQAGLEI